MDLTVWFKHGLAGGWICGFIISVIANMLGVSGYGNGTPAGWSAFTDVWELFHSAFYGILGIPFGLCAVVLMRLLFFRISDEFIVKQRWLLAVLTVAGGGYGLLNGGGDTVGAIGAAFCATVAYCLAFFCLALHELTSQRENRAQSENRDIKQ